MTQPTPTPDTTTTTTPTKKRVGRKGTHTPPNKRQLNVYITEEASDLLLAILERDGVPYSAQIERAVRLWAEHKGITIEVAHDKLRPGTPDAGVTR